MRNNLELGSWNALCDRCGLKCKNYMLAKEWTGLIVCKDTCWEPRHPQTMLHVPEEQISTPWARPEPTDNYILLSDNIVNENSDFISLENGALLGTEI